MSDQLPLCSSDQILAALKRVGFTLARRAKDSHQPMIRVTPQRTDVAVVVLGKRQVTRGTLRSILDQAGLSADESRQHLR